MTTAQAHAVSLDAFEARAKEDGFINVDGAFVQSDWEFELETMTDRSRDALVAHLAKAPAGNDTALYLKGLLMDNRTHFTPLG